MLNRKYGLLAVSRVADTMARSVKEHVGFVYKQTYLGDRWREYWKLFIDEIKGFFINQLVSRFLPSALCVQLKISETVLITVIVDVLITKSDNYFSAHSLTR